MLQVEQATVSHIVASFIPHGEFRILQAEKHFNVFLSNAWNVLMRMCRRIS